MRKILLAGLFLFFLFGGCRFFQSDNAIDAPDKQLLNTPFLAAQKFLVTPGIDSVYRGMHGTLMVFPDSAFIDASGQVVKGNVQIKLMEAFSPTDMLLNGLTTMSDGKPLVSGGMLYFKAFADNKEVFPNPRHQPYLQIPSIQRQEGMQVYSGKRDDKGNINWSDPRPLENFLVHVDLDLLNFYPPGFEKVVEDAMPILGHTVADKQLKDSLYYSFGFKPKENDGLQHYDTAGPSCDLNPSTIKVIRNKEYENTYIATREFEERLQALFSQNIVPGMNAAASKDFLVRVYINNIGSELCKADSIVYGIIIFTPSSEKVIAPFKAFMEQHLTNVKNGSIYASRLSGFFNKKLKTVNEELDNTRIKAAALADKKSDAYIKLQKEYSLLLEKRDTYRMTYYGFTATENGWVNIDNGTEPKSWEMAPLIAHVQGGEEADTVFSYVVYNNNQTLLMMKPVSKTRFESGDQPMPKNATGMVVSVAFKDKGLLAGIQEFETLNTPQVTIMIKETDQKTLEQLLARYDTVERPENMILKDVEYQRKLINEFRKKQEVTKSDELYYSMRRTIYTCDRFDH